MSPHEAAWTVVLLFGVPALALHLLSVTLTKALRAYSPTRLEEVCERYGRPGRADEVAHLDVRTERAAEALAVITGLTLAALLGVVIDRLASSVAIEAVLPIALAVSALGYVLSGVLGRVFAERVIDALWPVARHVRFVTTPVTYFFRRVESLVESLAGSEESSPRPTSVEVEVELPSDGETPADEELELPESTRELFQRAIELSRRTVDELMTPRARMVTLPSTVSARAAARSFNASGLSRVPLYGENHDDIIGILYAKDLFQAVTDANKFDDVLPRKLVRAAYCVPETKNAYQLLDELRSRRQQMAIVLDEYGGVAGLITLEDLVEELVGEIDDEHDVPTAADSVLPLGGARYEVDASLSLEELNERLGLRLPTDGDFLTVGGLVFHALGRLPERGATFRLDGIEFQILEIADHSIRRVLIDLQPASTVGSS
ncbi:MAG: hemolysin family protein [Isosphaeraceae bacterium]